jgi:hypothetical protein
MLSALGSSLSAFFDLSRRGCPDRLRVNFYSQKSSRGQRPWHWNGSFNLKYDDQRIPVFVRMAGDWAAGGGAAAGENERVTQAMSDHTAPLSGIHQ